MKDKAISATMSKLEQVAKLKAEIANAYAQKHNPQQKKMVVKKEKEVNLSSLEDQEEDNQDYDVENENLRQQSKREGTHNELMPITGYQKKGSKKQLQNPQQ